MAELSLDTLQAVDLALSAVTADAISDEIEYAYGIVDGMRCIGKIIATPDCVPDEVLQDIDDNVEAALNNHSRVLGMLAGSLAAVRLFVTEETHES